MPLEKITKSDLSKLTAGGVRGATAEYVAFLKSAKPGEGGRTTAQKEGVAKTSIKQRLKKASEVAGVPIKFLRSAANEVIFVVEAK